MAQGGELAVVLKLVADQFQNELKKSGSSVEQFKNLLTDWRLHIVAAGTALAAIAKSTANYGDELNKTSQKIGVSVQALSALRHAADLSGLSAEQLTTGLKFLARTSVEAASGGTEAMLAFNDVGVEIRDAGGKIKPVETLLLDVADAFAKSKDDAAKTALALKIFGRAGIDLIPMLNQGRAGIEGLMKEAERLGLVMSKEAAQKSEEFNDNLLRLERTLTGVKIGVGNQMIPALNRLAETLLKLTDRTKTWKEKLNELGQTFIGLPSPLLKMLGAFTVEATGGLPKQAVDPLTGEKLPPGARPTGPKPMESPLPSLSITDPAALKRATGHYLNFLNALDKMNKDMREKGAERDKALRESEAANILANLPENRPPGAVTDRIQHFPTTPGIRKLIEEESDAFGRMRQQSASLELRNNNELEAANAELNERKRRANQSFFDSYKEGMRDYVGTTGQTFNLATDMARATAEAMNQAFTQFFFNLFEGKMRSLKDLLNGVLDFVKRIAAEIAAKVATTAVLRSVGFAHDGGEVRRFAFGGPVFSNNDSVPAVLTPGEGVLTRRGMAALDRLNNGQVGGGSGTGDVIVNIVDSGQREKPDVNVHRQMEKLVVDIIFKAVGSNDPLRQLFLTGGRVS